MNTQGEQPGQSENPSRDYLCVAFQLEQAPSQGTDFCPSPVANKESDFYTTPWATFKGRQPVGLGIMLCIYFLQHWFNLSAPGAEDALYESPVLRGFAGVDLDRAASPDETTILNFRHLLEQHDLCGKMLEVVNLCTKRVRCYLFPPHRKPAGHGPCHIDKPAWHTCRTRPGKPNWAWNFAAFMILRGRA
jgi:hypothetical protein